MLQILGSPRENGCGAWLRTKENRQPDDQQDEDGNADGNQ